MKKMLTTAAAALSLFIKTLPFMLGLKVAGGVIDIGVHWVKLKMSNGGGFDARESNH